SIDDAAELGEQTVAHELEYSPMMPLDLRLKQLLAPRFQSRKRPRFITLHERGVTNDIGRENGREAPFHGRLPANPILRSSNPRPQATPMASLLWVRPGNGSLLRAASA